MVEMGEAKFAETERFRKYGERAVRPVGRADVGTDETHERRLPFVALGTRTRTADFRLRRKTFLQRGQLAAGDGLVNLFRVKRTGNVGARLFRV